MSLITRMRKLEKEALVVVFVSALLFEYLLFCRKNMISLVLGKWNDPGDS